MNPDRPQQAELERVYRVKQRPPASTAALGPEMLSFFRRSVARRQTKLAQLAECWSQFVPDTLSDHCALDAFSRGTLTVIVDSSSHLYELKQLLLAGLQQQLLIACKAVGLRKITLRPGRWYDGDGVADRKLRFDR